jgi:hypothetical protein
MSTKLGIGASDRRGEGAGRCQWRIARPRWINDEGTCMLLVTRQADGSYTVAIGRQGMCADIYTEAKRTGVADLDVDGVVMDLYYQRAEASGGTR